MKNRQLSFLEKVTMVCVFIIPNMLTANVIFQDHFENYTVSNSLPEGVANFSGNVGTQWGLVVYSSSPQPQIVSDGSGGQAVNIDRTSGTGVRIHAQSDPVDGALDATSPISISARILVVDTDHDTCSLELVASSGIFESSTNRSIDIQFRENGSVHYLSGPTGSPSDITTSLSHSVGQWNDVKIIVNYTNATFNLTVNGNTATNLPLYDTTVNPGGFSQVYFNAAGSTSHSLVDDFIVEVIGKIPEELLDIDDHGGTVIRLTDFDLTREGALWSGTGGHTTLPFEPIDGVSGCYKVLFQDDYFVKGGMSSRQFTVKSNTDYYVSALIKCNFDRADREVNLGIRITDDNWKVRVIRAGGVPATTDGWKRFEWRFTSDIRGGNGMFYMALYGFTTNDPLDSFYISDVAFIEMPAAELEPYDPGEGMVFGGSSGSLGMSITGVSNNATSITVTATGARYTFDKANDTITAEQLIGTVREVSSWDCSKSLASLFVDSQSSNEVVLTTGYGGVTFGVQLDGMLFATTHSSDLDLTCTSGIGGLWNRFSCGHLIAMDDLGGFTVNPDIPAGSGRSARTTVLTEGLDFIDKINDTGFISNADDGWQIKWTISPGERLAVGTFPPRPYDWENSFKVIYGAYDKRVQTVETFAYDKTHYGIDVGLLWNFTQRAWGMSYTNQYIPCDVAQYTNFIQAAKAQGIKPILYTSLGYWHNTDIDEFVDEVERQRDTYGIEGIYMDGIAHEWIKSYEAMRKLRESFTNGVLIVHNSGMPGGGGAPPLIVPDIFIPAIDTYATATFKGEGIAGTDRDWVYPRFVTSQYNKANCFGMMKGDSWTSDGETINLTDQSLIGLEYNGRSRLARGWMDEYLDMMDELEYEWQTYGTQSNFYEAYYAPLTRYLTQPLLTNYPSTVFLDEVFDSDTSSAAPEGWYIYALTNTDVIVAEYPDSSDKSVCLYDNSTNLNCSASKKFVPLSGLVTFEYKFNIEPGILISEQYLCDSGDTIGILLQISGGYIKYRDNVSWTTIQAVNTSTWYTVKIVADTDTDTNDIYINDTKIITGADFRNNVASLCKFLVRSTSASIGIMYYDDVKVSKN